MKFNKPTFQKNYSSLLIMVSSVIIIVIAAGSVSYYFDRSLREGFLEQNKHIVSDLIAKQAEKHFAHLGITSTEAVEENPQAVRVFDDFSDEQAKSLHFISAMKLFTTKGKLIWSNLSRESGEELFRDEKMVESLVGATGDYSFLVPINNQAGSPIAILEVHSNVDDASTELRKSKRVLWGATALCVLVIYLLLRYTFIQRDTEVSTKSKMLNSIVDESPIGIYTMNKLGTIETYNPAMMKISGISKAEETIGKNVFDAEAYKISGLDKLLKDATEGSPFETEIEITSSLAKHKKTWRHYYGVPIKNSDGDVEYVLVLVEDITKQKSLENQVKEYGAELERKISGRTRELGQKLDELQRFQRLTVDRELKMVELKQQIEKMRIKLEEAGININSII